MDDSKITITIGGSIILYNMINAILTKTEEVNGQKIPVSRNLPFRLSYRLSKDLLIFEKDVKAYEAQKTVMLAEYGEEEDGQIVIKDPEKLNQFNDLNRRILGLRVEHEIRKLEPEDLERINDEDISFSADAMKMFVGYMTNDPDLIKEIETRLNFDEVVKNKEQK